MDKRYFSANFDFKTVSASDSELSVTFFIKISQYQYAICTIINSICIQ